jgi:hypothetical protein
MNGATAPFVHPMLFIFLIGYRLAFLALSALTLAAEIPLAFAWARVLPDEPPPFDNEPGPTRSSQSVPPKEPPRDAKRDPIAILFLVLMTLSYAIQFPGFPRHAAAVWLDSILPTVGPARVFLGVEGLFVLVNVGAACYSLLRPNSLRVPLWAGAALVLLLCLLGPFLRAALLATS